VGERINLSLTNLYDPDEKIMIYSAGNNRFSTEYSKATYLSESLRSSTTPNMLIIFLAENCRYSQ
jgi:hypothetical protein